jgi:hypothetical protein
MRYEEFLNRKNADNFLYNVEWKHNNKIAKYAINYSEVVDFCETNDIKDKVLIWKF